MKTALITGSLGFCARHLTKKLHALDDEIRVCGIDLAEQAPSGTALDEYFQVDICDPDKLEGFIKFLKPDWIFHLAGFIGDNLSHIYSVNFMGSIYLMEFVRKYSPESRIVIIGSSAEYGLASPGDFPLIEDHPCHPINAYGISKHAVVLAGLNYVQSHRMKIVTARPFNIVGPGIPQTLVVGAILKRIKDSLSQKDKLIIKMGNLHTERDFIDVNDVVDAYIKMAQGDFWGEIFNICSGKPYSIRRIVELIASFSGLPVEIEYDPALVRLQDIDVSFGSYAKANGAFGFKPLVDIEQALFETWQQYMKNNS